MLRRFLARIAFQLWRWADPGFVLARELIPMMRILPTAPTVRALSRPNAFGPPPLKKCAKGHTLTGAWCYDCDDWRHCEKCGGECVAANVNDHVPWFNAGAGCHGCKLPYRCQTKNSCALVEALKGFDELAKEKKDEPLQCARAAGAEYELTASPLGHIGRRYHHAPFHVIVDGKLACEPSYGHEVTTLRKVRQTRRAMLCRLSACRRLWEAEFDKQRASNEDAQP